MPWPSLNLGGTGGGLNLGGTTDPNAANAAYQMPRLPWGQNDFITTAALGLLGGRNLNEGLQNVAQMAPAGLAANTAKRRDMYSLQEKARTDAEKKAEQARQYAAMNVGLKLRSGVPLTSLTPAEQAAWAAAPDVALELGKPQVLAEGSTVWDPLSGPPPAAGAVRPPKLTETMTFQQNFAARPAYKRIAETKGAYDSMVQSAGKNTRAADLDLVYGIAKILDPIGAVRGEDTVNIQNTASYPNWLLGQIEAFNGGAALTPETRRNIMTMAQQRMQAIQNAFDFDRQQALDFAKRHGIAEEDVPDIEDIPAYDPSLTTGATPPPRPAD